MAYGYEQQTNPSYGAPVEQAALRGQVSFVPAGTPIQARINSTLSSEFSSVGETFTATLSGPIYAGSQMVAGPGSTIQGQVVDVQPGGRGGKPGSIDIRLTSVITADGRRYPLSARVDSTNFSLSAEGGRASHMVKTTAVGAGAGALSGLIGGAISGGKKGKATAIGTGIGAGVGLLGGAIKKGKDFVLRSGTNIPFVLDQPLQVNVAPASPVNQSVPANYSYGQQPAPQPQGYANPYL